jgi:hypothetical protein
VRMNRWNREATDRVEVMEAMFEGSIYKVNCEDKPASVAFCVELA